MSEGALQNAIARPINRFKYEYDFDVCNLAGALIFGLAKAHAFEQGNKRTAFVAGLFFIEQNGYGFHGSLNGMDLGLKIIALCEDNANEQDIIEFLRHRFVYQLTPRWRIVSAADQKGKRDR